MTQHAQVAKLIRAELKIKYPRVNFSVRSESFAGGNSVSIRYDKGKDTPPEKDVNATVKKYQAGYFDGMTDCYMHDKNQTGPTVMFVTATEHYPKEVAQAVNARMRNELRSASPEEYQSEYNKEFESYLLTH